MIALSLIGSACAQSSSTQTDAPTQVLDAPAGSEEAGDTGESSTEEGGATPVESASSVPDRPANPLPVTFVPDAAASVSVEIDAAGGSLTTTDSNGVTYTLMIPEGALFGSEQITMTPIALTESPFEDATAFAVSLEPDGLVFFEPATLEISGPTFNESTSLAFSSDHSGDDFGAQLAVMGDTATVRVTHFSLGGLVEAQEAEIESIFDEYAPRSREGRHLQDIAAINRLVEDLDARGATLGSILESWFGELRVDASTANDATTVESLLGEFINARSYLDLLRTLDGGSAIGMSTDQAMVETALALEEAAARLFDQENLRCIQDRDPDAMFAMLKWALVYAWIAGNITGEGSRNVEMGTAIKRCAHFRVEFSSSTAAEFFADVNASVPLELPTDLILNTGTLSYPTVTGTLTGFGGGGKLSCTAQAQVDVGMQLSFNPVFGHLSDSEFDGAAVAIRFHVTNWVCDGMNIQQALWIPWFVEAFPSYRTADGFFRFDTQRSNEVGVWTELKDAKSAHGVSATFEVKLIHDPQLP